MERGEFEAAPQVAAPAKKGGKGATALAVLFALIAAGLGVWLAIVLLNPAKQDNCGVTANSNNGSAATVDNDVKIRELVEEVRAAHYNVLGGYDLDRRYDSGVEISIGDGVIMRTNHSYGLDSSLDEDYRKLVDSHRSALDSKVSSIFDKYGLKKTSAPKGYYAWGNEHYAFYEGGNIICYYTTGYGLGLECADENWYSKEDKDLTLALANAYKKSEGEAIGYLDAKTKGITKNKAGTYELITASEDDAVALFYRKVGDGDWKFFTALQQGPWCDSFNTAELKEAYEGEECLSVNGDTAVVKK